MRISAPFFFVFALFVGLSALLVAAGPAVAQSDDVFTVRNVAVDKTAQSAAQAREAAIAQGQQLAFQQLVQRLVPDYEWSRMPSLDTEQLAALVQDFSVADERTSAVRYLAELTIRFRPDAVRSLFRRNGLSFAVTQSEAVLVLPVYSFEGLDHLWDSGNPWFDTWALRKEDNGLVPFIVPLGDLSDVATIDTERALAADGLAIETMAERYGTGQVMTSHAMVSGDPAAGTGEMELTSWQGTAVIDAVVDRFSQNPDESLEDFLARAADGVAYRIEENWKQQNLLEYGDQRSLPVWTLTNDLPGWLEIKDRLARVASVERMELSKLSRGWSLIQLSYVGDEEKLVTSLAQRRLRLALSLDNEWLLSRVEDEAPPRREGAAGFELDGEAVPLEVEGAAIDAPVELDVENGQGDDAVVFPSEQ